MSIPFLQTWYQKQCDGYWEHVSGITIETLDNPGWLMTVDLAETPLRDTPMATVSREKSDKDWLLCEVSHQKFRGQGDPQKLGEILQTFQSWASSHAK